MKFLVDAQLPVRLAVQLAAAGHDTIHTSEMPNGNRTTDAEIATVAETEDRGWPNGVDLDPDVLHGDHPSATGRSVIVLREYTLRQTG